MRFTIDSLTYKTMNRNIRFVIFAGLIATFSVLGSCVSEEDQPSPTIVGTWNFDSYSLSDATINGQPVLTYMTTVMGLTPQQAQLAQSLFLTQIIDQTELAATTLTFNADGNYIVRVNGVEEDSGTYSLQNNNTKLLLTSVNGNQEFNVSELTSNKVILVLEDSDQFDVNTDGNDENVAYSIEFTLVK